MANQHTQQQGQGTTARRRSRSRSKRTLSNVTNIQQGRLLSITLTGVRAVGNIWEMTIGQLMQQNSQAKLQMGYATGSSARGSRRGTVSQFQQKTA